MDEIKVHVVAYRDRANLVMRYLCPETNRQVSRSTGTSNAKAAAKEAAKWEAELQDGRYHKRSRMSWEQFREFYSENALPGLAAGSIVSYEVSLNVFERLTNPKRLSDVTTARVTKFATELRQQGRREATIARHLRHLKAAMRWANKQGILPVVPQFNMPKRVKGAKVMRGRPVTTEEYERMLKVIPAVDIAKRDPEAWRFYLRGLWTSGLRLSESLSLRWDDAPGCITVDLSGRYPMLRIPADAQKANRDQLLPITPDFAELLQGVPEASRRGRVFRVGNDRYSVGKVVAAIGEKARIIVDPDTGKYATAHDLRRAFGTRWSRKVMPTVLKELMRHASLATTMSYYVQDDAEETAKALWSGLGTISGNTQENGEKRRSRRSQKSPKKQG